MFGGLAFLIDGKMAVSASSKGGLLLRIDPTLTESLVIEPHVRPFEAGSWTAGFGSMSRCSRLTTNSGAGSATVSATHDRSHRNSRAAGYRSCRSSSAAR